MNMTPFGTVALVADPTLLRVVRPGAWMDEYIQPGTRRPNEKPRLTAFARLSSMTGRRPWRWAEDAHAAR